MLLRCAKKALSFFKKSGRSGTFPLRLVDDSNRLRPLSSSVAGCSPPGRIGFLRGADWHGCPVALGEVETPLRPGSPFLARGVHRVHDHAVLLNGVCVDVHVGERLGENPRQNGPNLRVKPHVEVRRELEYDHRGLTLAARTPMRLPAKKVPSSFQVLHEPLEAHILEPLLTAEHLRAVVWEVLLSGAEAPVELGCRAGKLSKSGRLLLRIGVLERQARIPEELLFLPVEEKLQEDDVGSGRSRVHRQVLQRVHVAGRVDPAPGTSAVRTCRASVAQTQKAMKPDEPLEALSLFRAHLRTGVFPGLHETLLPVVGLYGCGIAAVRTVYNYSANEPKVNPKLDTGCLTK